MKRKNVLIWLFAALLLGVSALNCDQNSDWDLIDDEQESSNEMEEDEVFFQDHDEGDVRTATAYMAWAIGPTQYSENIYRSETGITPYNRIQGLGTSIAGGQYGISNENYVWVVGTGGSLWKMKNGRWINENIYSSPYSIAAHDIGVGNNPEGRIYAVGDYYPGGPHNIFRYDGHGLWSIANEAPAEARPAVRVDVQVDIAWIVGSNGRVYREQYPDGPWNQVGSITNAVDIGVGAAAFVATSDGGLYRLNGSDWVEVEDFPTSAKRVSCGVGTPLYMSVLDTDGRVWVSWDAFTWELTNITSGGQDVAIFTDPV